MINFANGSEPIINPWLFYLADALDAAKFVVIVVAFVSALIGVTCVLYGCNEEDLPEVLHFFKIMAVTFGISATVAVFLPSKNTIYTMAIAQALTPDNVKMAYDVTGKTANDILNGGSEFIKDIMDYGVEKIDEIRTGDSEEE